MLGICAFLSTNFVQHFSSYSAIQQGWKRGNWIYLQSNSSINSTYFFDITGITGNQNIIRINKDTGLPDPDFKVAHDGIVADYDDTHIYIVTHRTYLNVQGSSRGGALARVDIDTGVIDAAYGNGFGWEGGPGVVRKLVVTTDSLYVLGSFDYWNGEYVKHIIKLVKSTGVRDANFDNVNPNVSTITNGVYCAQDPWGHPPFVSSVLEDGDKLYIVGFFSHYKGVEQHGLIRVDRATGALDTTFNLSNAFNFVDADFFYYSSNWYTQAHINQIVKADTDLLWVAGRFKEFDGSPKFCVTRIVPSQFT